MENLKKIISAKVSLESADGFTDFCKSNGISLSAFLEVAGLDLKEETTPPSPVRQRVVERAREVDQLRRRRS